MSELEDLWARCAILPYLVVAIFMAWLAPRAFPETAAPPLLLEALVLAGAFARATGPREPRENDLPLLQLGLAFGTVFLYATAAHLIEVPGWPPRSEDPLSLLVDGLGSLPGLAALALLALFASVPHLYFRGRSLALESQAFAGLLSGACIALTLNVGLERSGAFMLLTAAAFSVLGAGAAHVDRALKAKPPSEPLAPVAILLATCLCLGGALSGRQLVEPVRTGLLEEGRNPAVEARLEDLAQRLGTRPPDSLTEVGGLDPDLAIGVKDGYLYRYARVRERTGGWALAADPIDGVGVHYRRRNVRGLEMSPSPFPLYPP